jgi:hypothetical protein
MNSWAEYSPPESPFSPFRVTLWTMLSALACARGERGSSVTCERLQFCNSAILTNYLVGFVHSVAILTNSLVNQATGIESESSGNTR